MFPAAHWNNLYYFLYLRNNKQKNKTKQKNVQIQRLIFWHKLLVYNITCTTIDFQFP